MVIKKYKPKVIGITGSVGKTSAKEAIFCVLKNTLSVRKSEKNYNNEFGVPLTVLGMKSPGKSIFGWLWVFIKALWLCLFRSKEYPKILILEMAADKKGDLEYLTSIVRPNISVVTSVAPVHLEFFGDIESIAKEKSTLVKNVLPNGFVILNADDEAVAPMNRLTNAHVIFYGFSERANLKADKLNIDYDFSKEHRDQWGIHFKINYEGKVIPVFLPKTLGKHQVYAALVGIAVGICFKMNLIDIAETLRWYQSPPGRLKLIPGVKNTLIIDDTYNSSPLSCEVALNTLQLIPKKGKKFVVLGDMLELGRYSEEAHIKIGEKIVALDVDYLICVGEKSRDILRGARGQGMSEEKMFHFSKSEQVGRFLKERIHEHDILLIKGSQGMRMEKIVKELMAEPLKACDLLVRQGPNWVC